VSPLVQDKVEGPEISKLHLLLESKVHGQKENLQIQPP